LNPERFIELNKKFHNTSSNSPPPLSVAPIISSLLPPNEPAENDKKLQTSVNIVREYKGVEREQRTKKNSSVKPKKVQFPPSFKRPVPLYVFKAYSRFASHVNESDELNGLKFIGIIRFGLSAMDDDNPYIWHHTENATNNVHQANHQKEFSYSVLTLDKVTKTKDQLESDLDKWIFLFLHASKMTEEEVDSIFGDEPIFQEIFQILKFDNLPPDKLEKYYRSEKNRHSNQNSMRSDYEEAERKYDEMGVIIGEEMGSRICQKVDHEINQNKSAIMNGTMIAEEIVGPIVDENFDQGLMIVTERDKLVARNRLKQQGYKNVDNIDYEREEWSNEEIQELKDDIIKELERAGLIPPRSKQEDELAKQNLAQGISHESTTDNSSALSSSFSSLPPPPSPSSTSKWTEEVVNQESKKVTDEKKKQIAMDMLKRGFGIQEIALLTNWTDETIKKLKEEVVNQESKRMTDEKQKQIAMDILKRGFGIQEIALFTNWTDEAIKKLKEEIENQESKRMTDEKQKQTAMDMLKRGFGIQEIALFTNWTDEAIKKLKEEVVNQESKRMTDEKQKQIAMDMLKRGFGIQEIALFTNWTDEAIKKLKDEIENQESKKISDEKQKQAAIDMLKMGISIQQVVFLTKWTEEDTKKLKDEIENQESKKMADEEQKQISIDILKRESDVREIALLTKWTDDNIKKLKEEVVNQEFQKVTDEKKKQITMDILKRGFDIQETALLTSWIEEATMNQKFESALDLEYQIELDSESQQLKVEDALVKGKPLYVTLRVH
jgi:GTP cyclohydrolase II